MTNEAKPKYPPKRAVVLSVVLVPLIAWFAFTHLFDINLRPVDVSGTIQAKEIPVASKIGGRIARVLVQEGQEVKAGDVLVEFEAPELAARRLQLVAAIKEREAILEELKNGPRLPEIEKARAAANQAKANWIMLKSGYRKEDISKSQAQVNEAQANFDMLKRGYREEDVRSARNQLEQARVLMEFQKQDWQRYQGLSEQGAVSARDASDLKSKYDASREAFRSAEENFRRMQKGPREEEIESARERLEFARNQMEMMRRGPRPEEIEMAKQEYLSANQTLSLLLEGTRKEQIDRAAADLAQSKAQLSEIDAQLIESKVASPANAEVSVMDLHAGEVIGAGRAVATLTRLDDLWTRVYIPERELGRVRMGQELDVKADSFPGRKFLGKVVQIPSVAEFTPRNVQTPEERSAQVFGVKVQIDNKDHLLRGGMNADITLPPVEGPFARLAGH
jgi:multidrug resistance efflux pump